LEKTLILINYMQIFVVPVWSLTALPFDFVVASHFVVGHTVLLSKYFHVVVTLQNYKQTCDLNMFQTLKRVLIG